MGKYDDKILLNAQNTAWMNMYDYYNTNGTEQDSLNMTDHWSRCIDYYGEGRCNITAYMRNKTAMFPGFEHQMEIVEPCTMSVMLRIIMRPREYVTIQTGPLKVTKLRRKNEGLRHWQWDLLSGMGVELSQEVNLMIR